MKFSHLLFIAIVCLALAGTSEASRWKKLRRRIENAVKKVKVCTAGVCVERGKRSVELGEEPEAPSQCRFSPPPEENEEDGILRATRGPFRPRPRPRPRPVFPDPYNFESAATSFDDDDFKGNFTIRNGTIGGLSSLRYHYRLFRLGRNRNAFLTFGTSMSKLIISGDYEVAVGFANFTSEGVHTFSGAGPLNVSLVGVEASLRAILRVDPQTRYVSIGRNRTSLSIRRGSIEAGNFEVDGELVDWVIVNQNLRSLLSLVWEETQDDLIDEINEEIQGCTLRDIERILGPRRIRTVLN